MFGHSTLQTVSIGEDAAHGVALVEHACRAMQGRSDIVVPYTLIYRNLLADSFVSSASVNIAVRDHEGFALGTYNSLHVEIPPLGFGVWRGALTAANGKPLTVEAEVREVHRHHTGRRPEQFVPFPIERVRFTGKHDGNWNATGEVANPYSTPLNDLRIIVLARDAAGRLIDSAETFAGQIAPGRSAPFEMDSWGPAKPANYEIITYPFPSRGGWEALVAEQRS